MDADSRVTGEYWTMNTWLRFLLHFLWVIVFSLTDVATLLVDVSRLFHLGRRLLGDNVWVFERNMHVHFDLNNIINYQRFIIKFSVYKLKLGGQLTHTDYAGFFVFLINNFRGSLILIKNKKRWMRQEYKP